MYLFILGRGERTRPKKSIRTAKVQKRKSNSLTRDPKRSRDVNVLLKRTLLLLRERRKGRNVQKAGGRR